MMDAPKIGQIVKLNDETSLDHWHDFEVVAVRGKLADLRKPHVPWRSYTLPLNKLMSKS